MLSFDQTIDLMLIDLEQVEGTLILFGVCDDTVLRDHAVNTLRKRLPPGITLRDFRYDPEHLSLLEGAIETTASGNGRPAVSVTGFETLPRDKRTEAIKLLNMQRNRFGRTGIAVILWVNRATLAEISTQSADFYSWRSGTFIIEPPPGWNTLESARRGYLQALVSQNEFVNLQGLAPTRGGQIVQMRMGDIFVPLRAEQEVKLGRVLFSTGVGESVEVEIVESAGGEPSAREKTGKRRVELRGKTGETLLVEGKNWSQSASLDFLKERAMRQVEHEVRTRRVEISELLQEHRAVVLGDPGTGKTTLLRYLAYSLAQGQIANFQPEIIGRTPELADCLPVYIRIGEYAQHLQANPQAPLDAFAPLGCQARQLPLSDTLLNEAMGQGRVLFLLDGLDEIVETGQRREIARRIEKFAGDHSQCRLVVTSRLVGYREVQLGGAFVQFTISPFADEDIRRFTEKWYAALGMPDSAKELVQAIQENPSVRRLAANPLLLTVIALIHWRGTKLPHHRAKLYSQAAETLVDQWMSQRRVSPEGWDVHETLQVLLPATAWHLHSTTSSGLIGEQELHNLLVETLRQHDPRLSENAAHSRASQFRRNVSEFSGIFLERGLDQDGRGLYGFLHLTFEEYFTAVHLADKWEREGKSVLKPLLHDPRWSETILLTAGLLSESSQYRATQFVKTILSARSEYENILHRDLLMAARCLADEVRVDAEVRRAISGKLLKLYFDFKLSDALREDIRQVFARLGGTTVEKDVSEALIERLTDSDRDVRQAAARALGQLGAAAVTPEVLATLLKPLTDSDEGMREAAIEALGQLGAAAATPEVVTALLRRLADSRLDLSTTKALGQLGAVAATPEVVAALLPRLTDSFSLTRRWTAEALRQLLGAAAATPEVVTALLRRLADSDWFTAKTAAETLGQLGAAAATPEVVVALLKYLTSPSRGYAHEAAALALGQLGAAAATPEVVTALLQLLTHPKEDRRRAAALALGQLGAAAATPEVVAALFQCLTDSEVYVREKAALALGQLGAAAATPEVVAALLQLLSHYNSFVSYAAARALGQLGAVAATPEVVATLLLRLTDFDLDKSGPAAQTLGYLGAVVATPEVVAALLGYLKAKGGGVALALGQLGAAAATPEVLTALLKYLPDSNRCSDKV